MNPKQRQAGAILVLGIASAVALDKVNRRNAAILGIPPLLVALIVAALTRAFS